MTQVDADIVLRKMEAKIAELTRTVYVYESQVEKLYSHIQELETAEASKAAVKPLRGKTMEDS